MRRAPPSSLLLLALACAGDPPPLPAGATATPAPGDPLALLVAKLAHAEGEPAAVEIRELRFVDVAREPWRTLDAGAAGGRAGPVAVIAGRRCTFRAGLSRTERTRGGWYLLHAGRLAAFDHRGFGAECAEQAGYQPAAAGEVALERSLGRYVAQRYEPGEVPADQRLARGLALLARDRAEDALYELHALDRRIDELSRRQTEYETPDPEERARLRREEEALRPARAQLYRALADIRREEELQP